MKKLFSLFSTLLIASFLQGQCVYTCSNYAVSQVSHTFYTGPGTPVTLNDDDISTTIGLNFNFDFYCNTYNYVRICSNGFITFDISSINLPSTPYAQSLPSTNIPNDVIAWNWNDLDPSVGGSITYTILGSPPNQKFVVTYSDVPIWSTGGNNTGQIVLHEGSNLITISIITATNNGWLTHTEGIENASASTGTAVAGRNLSLWLATNQTHIFSPYAAPPPVSVSGTTLLCQGAAAIYSTSASGASSYNWNFPPGWQTSGNTAAITATANVSGTLSVSANYTCGPSQASTLAINVLPAPVVSISASSPASLCAGSLFSVVPSGAASYTLQPSGANGTSTLTVTPYSTTIYTLSGTNSSGCVSMNSPTVIASVKPSPTVTVNSGTICSGQNFTLNPSGAFSYNFSTPSPVINPPVGYHTYSVTGTGTNGCVGPPALSQLTVLALPTISITTTKTFICVNSTATLTASGADTYTWINASSTGSVAIVTVTAHTAYSVTGTSSAGCVNSSKIQINTSSCIGLEEETINDRFKVFPNPSSGIFIVSGDSKSTMCLMTITGKIVFEKLQLNDKQDLDLSLFPSGLYILAITSGSGTAVIRLVKD